MGVRGSDVLLIIVAILVPPISVFFMTGCSCDFLINILLTVLGYLPGHIHALWLIYKKMKAEERYGRGGYHYIGNGTYEPINDQPGMAPAQAPPVNYGATGGNYVR
ncbi:uncharacterized protein PHACADRAFT_253744 [Phanerochaete carnosa HHB-10118-sp]|uniref:Stress response RCI peptide n=1 Tax=Phanerochaete carnosa (strain HHB-10118-sp) TaxID=650164 RepID=K5V210_PHACS|nr:uncharacterized protein PHACADRAFT_253744 [Phanerochaete carnosa HHB-10118-sp]EKM56551.1 hypothetical protein PHACADRAFT_253744 [Phanerochaete carnosa HHB-10118-sp]